MFDKNLFLALCEKYNVELSDSAEKPMMKDANGVHEVTDKDVYHAFASCQILQHSLEWHQLCCRQ